MPICGPNVTDQVTEIWRRIQSDFYRWTEDQKLSACSRVLLPFQRPTFASYRPTNVIRSMADIDGWDVLPLYQGASEWLRTPPVYIASSNGPCASPSSLNPGAGPFDGAHESPLTCSNTVEVSGQCWLNGTVNYGTYGIMVRLCHDHFPWRFRYALEVAKGLIATYKTLGQNPEGRTLPIAWVEATYYNGPTGRPGLSGNRPNCRCRNCPCRGNIVTWDYVWEPVKPRSSAVGP
jgi:hypothetical protein